MRSKRLIFSWFSFDLLNNPEKNPSLK